MAITKKDLQAEVDRLNQRYCSKSKNELRIDCAYGGYQVQLTGKKSKDGKNWIGLGSVCSSITHGYQSAREALNDLYYYTSRGIVESTIKRYNKVKSS